MSAHTPGEWTVRTAQTHFAEVVTTTGPGRVVVIARLPTPQTRATPAERRKEAAANALLIRAAPALLRELRAMVDEFSGYIEDTEFAAMYPIAVERIRAARAALSDAEESP